jgi:hypothetical protein
VRRAVGAADELVLLDTGERGVVVRLPRNSLPRPL